jgi:type II secretory pathway pseudopilin PulG
MNEPAPIRWSPRRAGFTFVEILASLAFLAILVPVIMGALALANRMAVTADRTNNAVQLGENQLAQLLVGNAWQSGGNSGDFGPDFPGYSWTLEQTPWPQDTNNAMLQLTLHVSFTVQARPREVQLTTLVSTALIQGAASSSS